MINYIKSELYRLFHSKGSYLFIAICSVLLISVNVLLASVGHSDPQFPYDRTDFSIAFISSGWSVLFILCALVASIVFGNEHANHTMKNSISYGIVRGNIYLGKFIVALIYALLAFLIILGLFIGTAYLLLENSGTDALMMLLKAILVALPLLISALAASHCFLFMIEGTAGAITSIIVATVVFPVVSNYLGMRFEIFLKLAKILPYNLMGFISYNEQFQLQLPWEGSAGYMNYWLYGLLWTLVFLVIGYIIFGKKEIK